MALVEGFNSARHEDLNEAQEFDRENPIETLARSFAKDVATDNFPSLATQRSLASRIQSGDEVASRQLIRTHLGLVAAVIYPAKDIGLDHHLLVQAGTNALVAAARSYEDSSTLDFCDHAVVTIEAALSRVSPLVQPYFVVHSSERPMERVIQFVKDLSPGEIGVDNSSVWVAEIVPESETEVAPTQSENNFGSALEEFSPRDSRVLQLLILSPKQIAEKLNFTKVTVENIISRARQKTGLNNATSLALELHRRGLAFDVRKPKKPLVEVLDSQEMEIARWLEFPYDIISERLGITQNLNSKVAGMKKRTGARSRVELALMAKLYDTGERRRPEPSLPREKLALKLGLQSLEGYDVQLLLELTTPRQNAYITAYYLVDEPTKWFKVAEEFGVKKSAAMQIAERGISKMREALQQGSD